jgi:hypothetical protein
LRFLSSGAAGISDFNEGTLYFRATFRIYCSTANREFPMINLQAARRNVNRFADGLVASYCRGCGLLIAASPKRKTLDLMEKLHQCPF